MPALEDHDLYQDAVLWRFDGYDSEAQALLDSPIQVPVRWLTYKQELMDPKNNTITLVGEVVLDEDVAGDVQPGSVVWLGTLDDWMALTMGTGSVQSGDEPELCEIVRFDGTPDIKNRNTRRIAKLMRYKGKVSGNIDVIQFVEGGGMSFVEGGHIEFVENL